GDGSDWSVNPEPETTLGVINDMFTIERLPSEHEDLRARFQDEPLFLTVIDAILNVNSTAPIRDRNRARHRASQYLIDQGKLWRIQGGTSVRPRSRVECVTRKEAESLAAKLHAGGGHWGRDSLKIALTDRIYSPKLDNSIMNAI
ncbi:hypothetical protein HYDPIDRAFT_57786, partial [Hydnomerulius pinastri MD-312]